MHVASGLQKVVDFNSFANFVSSCFIFLLGDHHQYVPDYEDCCNDDPRLDADLLCVKPEPVRTRNPLLCQKSLSSSSGYETCISSVSDNNTNQVQQPREGIEPRSPMPLDQSNIQGV